MLSIIIASNRDANFKRISENIAATVGVAYEVIRITTIERGLCAAYNEGASRAQYSYLCFVHDDVLFHTASWGENVIAHLSDAQTGVIGVMGGRYKSAFGLGWRDGRESFYRYNVKDGVEGGRLLRHIPNNETKSRVLCVDGAFLCCRKEIWETIRFDEKTFSGFHYYDADFSFRTALRYNNYVVADILLEHFSHGKIDAANLYASLRFAEKHAARLPRSLDALSEDVVAKLEGYALSEKLYFLKKNDFSISLRYRLLKNYFKRYGKMYPAIRILYFGFLKS